jgi:Predicted lipoprotein of unknown function (DUF2380)
MTDQSLPPGWFTQSATWPYWPKSLMGSFTPPAYEPWNQINPQSWQQPLGESVGSFGTQPNGTWDEATPAWPRSMLADVSSSGILGSFPRPNDAADRNGSAWPSRDGSAPTGRGILALLDQRNEVGGILAPLERLNAQKDRSLPGGSQSATPSVANGGLFARRMPIGQPWINSRPELLTPGPVSSLSAPSFMAAPTATSWDDPSSQYAIFGANAASTPSSQNESVAPSRHLGSTNIERAWEPLAFPSSALYGASSTPTSNLASTPDSADVISDADENDWVSGARYAQAQPRGGRRGPVGRELTVPEQNRIFFYDSALETLRELGPKNPNLESLSTPGWIPRQEDINRLNEEIVRLKRERGLSWLEPHHTLPRQFRDKFDALRIDIEDYITHMPNYLHRLRPNGLHTGPEHWNSQWEQFFRDHRNPTRDEVFEHLNGMLKQIPRRQP